MRDFRGRVAGKSTVDPADGRTALSGTDGFFGKDRIMLCGALRICER
jgi:hypothetical protein